MNDAEIEAAWAIEFARSPVLKALVQLTPLQHVKSAWALGYAHGKLVGLQKAIDIHTPTERTP